MVREAAAADGSNREDIEERDNSCILQDACCVLLGAGQLWQSLAQNSSATHAHRVLPETPHQPRDFHASTCPAAIQQPLHTCHVSWLPRVMGTHQLPNFDSLKHEIVGD